MIALALLLSLAEPTVYERQIVEQALTCRRSADPYTLLSFLRMEELAGVVDGAMGIVLATACVESGYSPRALGDCTKGHRRCRAHGMMQLWPWWVKYYGVDRFNPYHSVEAYLRHVIRQLPKVHKLCRKRGVAAWRIAEVRAVRSAGHDRCHQRSWHWRKLQKWLRAIRKLREL